jgi:hypothetical protein
MKVDEVKYLADFKKAHHRYEVYSYGIFKTAFDEQVKSVSKHVAMYGSVSPTLSDMLITKEPIEKAYKNVYINIGKLEAGRVLTWINLTGRQMSKKSLPSFFSDKWHRLLEAWFTNRSASRVSDVTETTREKVRQLLTDSQDLPISQRATYIEDTLNSPDFNRNRALMIARTESTAGANFGASLGNADADYQTNKKWLAIEDSVTRVTHREADGQVVANDDMFVVGSSECLFPGDLSLPASECVNCRCTAMYLPILKNGLPILKD